MRRHFFSVRIIALLLSVSVLSTQSVFAYSIENNFWAERHRKTGPQLAQLSLNTVPPLSLLGAEIKNPITSTIKIPSNQPALRELVASLPLSHGSIRKIVPAFTPKGTVVLIQDIHHNPEAQNNIAKTIQALIDQKKANSIALEGAWGPIDLSRFRKFPNQGVIHAVADYLLKTHKISGPIHTALTSRADIPPVIGIDHPVHYAAHVESVRAAAQDSASTKMKLKSWKQELTERKAEGLNPDLAAFDLIVERHRKGEIRMGEYAEAIGSRLASAFGGLGRPSRDVPANDHSGTVRDEDQLANFLEALRLEASLNFNQVEAQRSRLIETLSTRLAPQEIQNFLSATVAFRLGQIRHADFYDHLKNLCRENGIELNTVPVMNAYIRYVLLLDSIDIEKVVKEIQRLEEETYQSLIRTSEEKNLIAESRAHYLTERLVDFALTPEEWKAYKTMSEAKGSGPVASGPDPLASFEAFYIEAEARDQAMAENLIKAMNSSQFTVHRNLGIDERRTVNDEPKFTLLVAGGFHSPGLTRLLSYAGLNVILFAPQITQVEGVSGSDYLSVFTQEKTPLEKLFKGEKLFLPTPPMPEPGIIGVPVVAANEFVTSGNTSPATDQALFRSLVPIPGTQVEALDQPGGAVVTVNRGGYTVSEKVAMQMGPSGRPTILGVNQGPTGPQGRLNRVREGTQVMVTWFKNWWPAQPPLVRYGLILGPLFLVFIAFNEVSQLTPQQFIAAILSMGLSLGMTLDDQGNSSGTPNPKEQPKKKIEEPMKKPPEKPMGQRPARSVSPSGQAGESAPPIIKVTRVAPPSTAPVARKPAPVKRSIARFPIGQYAIGILGGIALIISSILFWMSRSPSGQHSKAVTQNAPAEQAAPKVSQPQLPPVKIQPETKAPSSAKASEGKPPTAKTTGDMPPSAKAPSAPADKPPSAKTPSAPADKPAVPVQSKPAPKTSTPVQTLPSAPLVDPAVIARLGNHLEGLKGRLFVKSNLGDRRLLNWAFLYDNAIVSQSYASSRDKEGVRRSLELLLQIKNRWPRRPDVYADEDRTINLNIFAISGADANTGAGKEWKVDSGPILHLGMAAINNYKVAQSADPEGFKKGSFDGLLTLAKEVAEYSLALRDPKSGGVRQGPVGKPGDNRDQRFGFDPKAPRLFDICTMEHQPEAHFVWNALSTMPGINAADQKKYKQAALEILNLIIGKYWDEKMHRFRHELRVPTQQIGGTYPTDVQAWAISMIGVETLTTHVLPGETTPRISLQDIEALFKELDEKHATRNAAGEIVGYDYIPNRGRLVSVEWTGEVLMAKLQFAAYLREHPDKAKNLTKSWQTYAGDFVQGIQQLSKLKPGPTGGLAYAYKADGTPAENVSTGFGWTTQVGEAMISPAYYWAIVNGYDPAAWGGGDIPLNELLKGAASIQVSKPTTPPKVKPEPKPEPKQAEAAPKAEVTGQNILVNGISGNDSGERWKAIWWDFKQSIPLKKVQQLRITFDLRGSDVMGIQLKPDTEADEEIGDMQIFRGVGKKKEIVVTVPSDRDMRRLVFQLGEEAGGRLGGSRRAVLVVQSVEIMDSTTEKPEKKTTKPGNKVNKKPAGAWKIWTRWFSENAAVKRVAPIMEPLLTWGFFTVILLVLNTWMPNLFTSPDLSRAINTTLAGLSSNALFTLGHWEGGFVVAEPKDEGAASSQGPPQEHIDTLTVKIGRGAGIRITREIVDVDKPVDPRDSPIYEFKRFESFGERVKVLTKIYFTFLVVHTPLFFASGFLPFITPQDPRDLMILALVLAIFAHYAINTRNPDQDPYEKGSQRSTPRIVFLGMLLFVFIIYISNLGYNGEFIDESFYAHAKDLGNVFYIAGDSRFWPVLSYYAYQMGGIETVRMLTAFLMTLTVAFVYKIAQHFADYFELQDRRQVVGYAAALLFAFSAPAWLVSTIGRHDALAFAFFAFSFWQLMRGIKRKDSVSLLLAAAALVFSINTRFMLYSIGLGIVVYAFFADDLGAHPGKKDLPVFNFWLPLFVLAGVYFYINWDFIWAAIEHSKQVSKAITTTSSFLGIMGEAVMRMLPLVIIFCFWMVSLITKFKTKQYSLPVKFHAGVLIFFSVFVVFLHIFYLGSSFTMERNLVLAVMFAAVFAGLYIGWLSRDVGRGVLKTIGAIILGVILFVTSHAQVKQVKRDQQDWPDWRPVTQAVAQLIHDIDLPPGARITSTANQGKQGNVHLLRNQFKDYQVDISSPWKPEPGHPDKHDRVLELEKEAGTAIVVGPYQKAALRPGDVVHGFVVRYALQPRNGPPTYIFVNLDHLGSSAFGGEGFQPTPPAEALGRLEKAYPDLSISIEGRDDNETFGLIREVESTLGFIAKVAPQALAARDKYPGWIKKITVKHGRVIVTLMIQAEAYPRTFEYQYPSDTVSASLLKYVGPQHMSPEIYRLWEKYVVPANLNSQAQHSARTSMLKEALKGEPRAVEELGEDLMGKRGNLVDIRAAIDGMGTRSQLFNWALARYYASGGVPDKNDPGIYIIHQLATGQAIDEAVLARISPNTSGKKSVLRTIFILGGIIIGGLICLYWGLKRIRAILDKRSSVLRSILFWLAIPLGSAAVPAALQAAPPSISTDISQPRVETQLADQVALSFYEALADQAGYHPSAAPAINKVLESIPSDLGARLSGSQGFVDQTAITSDTFDRTAFQEALASHLTGLKIAGLPTGVLNSAVWRSVTQGSSQSLKSALTQTPDKTLTVLPLYKMEGPEGDTDHAINLEVGQAVINDSKLRPDQRTVIVASSQGLADELNAIVLKAGLTKARVRIYGPNQAGDLFGNGMIPVLALNQLVVKEAQAFIQETSGRQLLIRDNMGLNFDGAENSLFRRAMFRVIDRNLQVYDLPFEGGVTGQILHEMLVKLGA